MTILTESAKIELDHLFRDVFKAMKKEKSTDVVDNMLFNILDQYDTPVVRMATYDIMNSNRELPTDIIKNIAAAILKNCGKIDDANVKNIDSNIEIHIMRALKAANSLFFKAANNNLTSAINLAKNKNASLLFQLATRWGHYYAQEWNYDGFFTYKFLAYQETPEEYNYSIQHCKNKRVWLEQRKTEIFYWLEASNFRNYKSEAYSLSKSPFRLVSKTNEQFAQLNLTIASGTIPDLTEATKDKVAMLLAELQKGNFDNTKAWAYQLIASGVLEYIDTKAALGVYTLVQVGSAFIFDPFIERWVKVYEGLSNIDGQISAKLAYEIASKNAESLTDEIVDIFITNVQQGKDPNMELRKLTLFDDLN